ncbi:MAG: delta-1-pyrroline-5-carboxylate dehydrogenase [Burkholderiales bacterium PBB1]|nr:MAG: delta-1-pyrroline-5-carboxylate dehydrogenase [Burkholderiales bacterium PBB1]
MPRPAPTFATVPERARLPHPVRPEREVLAGCVPTLQAALDWPRVMAQARPWVQAVRDKPAPFWALESLLREYPISSAQGLALMRLAEALLRVPDTETAIALTADQLGRADFSDHRDAHHPVLASLSAQVIALSKRLLPGDADAGVGGLVQRLGAQAVVAATVRAIQLLGRQFVLGRSIEEAVREADAQRPAPSTLCFSYDMLGEGARNDHDALRYLASYQHAIEVLAQRGSARGPEMSDGISIKLSALFSRYEAGQRERVMAELLPRVWLLVEQAARADINLTIDAEESERLELSLDVFEALASRVAQESPTWRGFGLAIQAYQTRALDVVDEVARIARAHGLRLMVRLVKGAYWDAEIKRAQELGLSGYPVYTHKHHTDVSYLACARALIGHAAVIYPQFATHNAGTIAAIAQMAQPSGARYELQRLHGMGVGVYRELMQQAPVPVRAYAPVGEHRDLLAYLVRRLLENGANSSFVHQLADESITIDQVLASPLSPADEPGVPLPVSMFGWRADDPDPHRRNSMGLDLTCLADRVPLRRAMDALRIDPAEAATPGDAVSAMARLYAAHRDWRVTPLAARAAVLRRAADALESRRAEFCALLVGEARKTWGDAVAEVREAIDFCRYYADQAEATLKPQLLPGPTGERNELWLHGRGVFVCISPWNFPLAIFAGQVAAALVAGNTVAAKPAEQTPAVAQRMVGVLHEAGVPAEALLLLHGPGETVGAALVADAHTAGVCFTGSTAVARRINRALAAKGGPIVPLIAETGGVNAMVVDSSALPEQVVDAVVQSAFRSAGQRCSALRLLCVHDSVADGVMSMIRGALEELNVGDPALWSTDVGPVIDDEAFERLERHVARLRAEARCIGESSRISANVPRLIAPIAFEVDRIADVPQEIFGPVLHVVRWQGDPADVIAQINALGYGLTLGLQTRIDRRAQHLAEAARVGNIYVNRNMVGAVVGVQPFGGEGLSGTGPKAGGPHYLLRFCAEQTYTVNTAAAGGNAELLSSPAPAGH